MQDRLNREVTTMNSQVKKLSDVENVGMIDSAFRGSLSVAILLSVLLVPAISSIALAALTFVAIYMGLTAFLGWDPFYALAKGSQHEVPEKVAAAATVAAGSKPAEHAAGDVHTKKAA
jgi:hypothetical protein